MPQVRLIPALLRGNWSCSLREAWSVRLFFTLATVLLCFSMGGCDNTKIIWSTEAPSVNGKWIATAQSVRHSGPGNNDIETMVYLTATSTGKKVEVLGFAHDPTLISNTIDLKLTWQTPTSLQITYTNHPKLYFQQKEAGGVEIVTEERPAITTGSP